jgi:hypothetical protein
MAANKTHHSLPLVARTPTRCALCLPDTEGEELVAVPT